ncbi:MAG TPA: ABC transporter permease, partial [Geobacteraceae bacterium]|nr:ABC transporter permease [Geobacteraceae bacterium]
MAHASNPYVEKLMHLLQYVGLSVAILALWQGLYHLGYIKPLILPPPTQVAATFWDLLKSGAMARHVGISVLRVLEGFGIAAFLGLSLGVAI